MTTLFKEMRVLKDAGKLHDKLIKRIRVLFIISTILLVVVLFNIFFRATNVPLVIAFAGIGFILGLYVFSKMNVVNWNEEQAIVQSGKMDIVGYTTLALYIIFEISFRSFLKVNFPTTVIPLLLSGIFGTIFGRAVGSLVEIHRVYTRNSEE